MDTTKSPLPKRKRTPTRGGGGVYPRLASGAAGACDLGTPLTQSTYAGRTYMLKTAAKHAHAQLRGPTPQRRRASVVPVNRRGHLPDGRRPEDPARLRRPPSLLRDRLWGWSDWIFSLFTQGLSLPTARRERSFLTVLKTDLAFCQECLARKDAGEQQRQFREWLKLKPEKAPRAFRSIAEVQPNMKLPSESLQIEGIV